MLSEIIHILSDYISIGTLGRLSRVNKELYNLTKDNETQLASFKSESKVKVKSYTIVALKRSNSRCRECGKQISTRYSLSQRICTKCARTTNNYHFMLVKQEIYPHVLKNAKGRFVLKKTKLLSTIAPTIKTSNKQYLYRISDVHRLAYSNQ